MTGRPTSDGSSRTSTDAKNESMSTCRTVQRSEPSDIGSATEPETPKALGIPHPGPAPVLLGALPPRPAGPLPAVGELAGVTRHRRHLGLDRGRDVHPYRGLEGARQQRGLDLIRGARLGEGVREG